MFKLIKRNKKYFENLDYENINLSYKQEIINSIQNNNLTIISGFYKTYKTNLISYIIKNSDLKDKYLYINKDLDLDNLIKNNNYLEFILMHYSLSYQKPKIIILENISEIKNIGLFIDYLQKNNYKIIVIGNKLDFLNKEQISKNNTINIKAKQEKKYKNISDINKACSKYETHNIISNEIIKPYSLKNYNLYNYTITFLSKINTNSSIREINRELNKNIKISLVTMIEYLKYSIQAYFIKQIKAFDFKKEKEIETKSKYYFTDILFRNSLYNFELDELLLRQNFLFSELDKRGYQINSGINGTYEFDFYVTKNNHLSSQDKESTKLKINTIFIDFCKSEDKKEIKKQINKLLKVPEKPENSQKVLTQNFSKYILLENPKEIGIKKLQYENLKIISLNELLEII